jgi:hypothetical protein
VTPSELFLLPSEDDAAEPGDRRLLDGLRTLLLNAESGPDSQHPARAETTVAIHLREPGGEPVPFAVLRLEEAPVSVTPGAGTAEIDLELSRADLAAFIVGRLHLPLAIARGDVAFRGPVRRLLRITPVLRSVGRAAAGDDGPPEAPNRAAEEEH